MTAVERHIASVINIISHPICMPVYIMAIFLYCNGFTAELVNEYLKLYVLIFVGIATIFIPFTCYLVLRKVPLYKQSETRKVWAGIFACLMAVVFYAISRSFFSINMPDIIVLFFVGNAFLIFLCGMVSFFARINFYAIGIGEIIALYMWFMRGGFAFDMLFLLALLFAFGIIGWAQIIKSKSHAVNYCLEAVIGGLFVIIALGYLY